MKNRHIPLFSGYFVLLGCFLVLVCIRIPGSPNASAEENASGEVQEATSTENENKPEVESIQGDIQVPPPPFSEDIFPCMNCHESIDPNPQRRKLEDFHEDIVLRHDEKNRWCLDCHDEKDRDRLRLASGKTISFEESYLLCGQCHGPKFRDWKAGVHGKRIGRWDGKERQYLLCVHCHSPHSPRFPGIKPMPTPVPPDHLRDSLKQPIPHIELPSKLPKSASGETDEEDE